MPTAPSGVGTLAEPTTEFFVAEAAARLARDGTALAEGPRLPAAGAGTFLLAMTSMYCKTCWRWQPKHRANRRCLARRLRGRRGAWCGAGPTNLPPAPAACGSPAAAAFGCDARDTHDFVLSALAAAKVPTQSARAGSASTLVDQPWARGEIRRKAAVQNRCAKPTRGTVSDATELGRAGALEKKANAGGGLDDTTASTPNLAIKSMLQIRTLICSVVRPPIEFCGQHWRHQGQLPRPALPCTAAALGEPALQERRGGQQRHSASTR